MQYTLSHPLFYLEYYSRLSVCWSCRPSDVRLGWSRGSQRYREWMGFKYISGFLISRKEIRVGSPNVMHVSFVHFTFIVPTVGTVFWQPKVQGKERDHTSRSRTVAYLILSLIEHKLSLSLIDGERRASFIAQHAGRFFFSEFLTLNRTGWLSREIQAFRKQTKNEPTIS